ncbi:hypothetical protein FISHEDRAFT_72923 [Fistulina hepatica ATCC 64428]|uniref:DUF6534 domain-containing protein n=1 Tax=Fistulina hepatica ATCC 64428 TaxID=1128425 RepID=A0A0D7AGZ5_9AGAR|nr:hypothetical protein FISHEDRAFT_72923 [Fistulina hepatica ATCC 64428]
MSTVATIIDETLGATLIGLIVSTLLLGITIMQTYDYLMVNSYHDRKLFKLFVAALLSMDLFSFVAASYMVYFFSITNFGNYFVFAEGGKASWSIAAQVGTGGIVPAMVQSFYAYRLYHLSDRRILLPAFIALCIVLQLGLTITASVKIGQELQSPTAQRFVIAALSLGTTADVLIAASMVYFLWKSRETTTFRNSRRVIDILMTYSVSTGIIATLFALATLIALVRKPDSLIQLAFFMPQVRAHTCAFFSMLNSRQRMRELLGGKGVRPNELTVVSVRVSSTTTEDMSSDVNANAQSRREQKYGVPEADVNEKPLPTLPALNYVDDAYGKPFSIGEMEQSYKNSWNAIVYK